MKKILSTFLFVLLTFAIFAESRNALLIANGKYKSFSSLANPVPEAEGLKKSLIELGFDVTIVTNASKEDMETAILAFQKKLSANKGIGFFHYGGHAVQVNGDNYLIPADADIPDEPRVSSRAVNVSEVMSSMQADTNIVILDSCRNNPLPSGSGRSASRGLQMVKVRPKNSVIVYSAEAGKTAQDGVFTPILTKKILENKELIAVLRDVRNEVDKATGGEQTPGQYDQLKNEVFLAMNVPSRLAKVESEASELDRQLEALRAKKSAAADREEQNRIAMETQRIEAEKKRKELEVQQVRDAEARRAAEQKRIEEENAKKNENQRLQEQQFAKMQADNAAKLKEIERLSAATNIDEMVASANSLYQTINNITESYTASMNKAIDETKAFYQKKKAEIVKSKYESEAEFADRRRSEEAALNRQQNQDISALQKQYGDEIADNTAELKRKLKALEGQTEVQTGNNIKLTFGEYNAEKRFFPAVITDTKNPSLKLGCPLEIKDYVEIEEHYTEQEKRVKQNTGKTKKQKKVPVEYEYVPVTKTRMKKVQIDRPVYTPPRCVRRRR
ncbi:MAG: caspase family protein, partial [Spirochaetales bacterium]|nr:caspase family protein [Spirochaetales bacterium]